MIAVRGWRPDTSGCATTLRGPREGRNQRKQNWKLDHGLQGQWQVERQVTSRDNWLAPFFIPLPRA